MNSKGAVIKAPWLDPSLFHSQATLPESQAFCRNLALGHYENFTVASLLLPRNLRQHFCNIYAYCRVSDDLADEIEDRKIALARLAEWEFHLNLCYQGRTSHPVFTALAHTIRQFDIPKEPFADLLRAFEQDQIQTRYPTWQDLLDYCRCSANPVGRLVLYLCGFRDPRRQELSDATCTALQLTNFWQDVDRDYRKGRIYVPAEIMASHGYGEELLAGRVHNPQWVSVMKDLIARTRLLFDQGLELCGLIPLRLRLDIELFSQGGLEILRAIESVDYDTLHHRPHLTRISEVRLGFRTLWRWIFADNKRRQRGHS